MAGAFLRKAKMMADKGSTKKAKVNHKFNQGYEAFFQGLGHCGRDESYSEGWIRAHQDNKAQADLIVNHRNAKRFNLEESTTQHGASVVRWVKK